MSEKCMVFLIKIQTDIILCELLSIVTFHSRIYLTYSRAYGNFPVFGSKVYNKAHLPHRLLYEKSKANIQYCT